VAISPFRVNTVLYLSDHMRQSGYPIMMTVRAAGRGGMYMNYVRKGLAHGSYVGCSVLAGGAHFGPVTWGYKRGDVDVPSCVEGASRFGLFI
jgi:hypothetical protein